MSRASSALKLQTKTVNSVDRLALGKLCEERTATTVTKSHRQSRGERNGYRGRQSPGECREGSPPPGHAACVAWIRGWLAHVTLGSAWIKSMHYHAYYVVIQSLEVGVHPVCVLPSSVAEAVAC